MSCYSNIVYCSCSNSSAMIILTLFITDCSSSSSSRFVSEVIVAA